MSFWTLEELSRFSYFELDGIRSPGVLQLPQMGEGIPRGWESQQGFALSGAFLRYTGEGLAEWEFTIWCLDKESRQIVDSAEWKRATAAAPLGQPDRKRRIRHPLLERRGIRECVLKNTPFEQPLDNGGSLTEDAADADRGGGIALTYKFLQARKPYQHPSKPASASNVYEGKVPDYGDQFIAGLSAQLEQALGNLNSDEGG